jgi:hypothetical protein
MKPTRLGLILSLAVGCDAVSDPPENACATLCPRVAACEQACDPVEEPDCDEAQRRRESLARCTDACGQGLEARPEDCGDAAERLSACLEARTCDDAASACAVDQMRYHELCVAAPGALACPLFCSAMAAGCLTYAQFGFRGPGCVDACAEGMASPACREAHYTLGLCDDAIGAACVNGGGACAPQLSAVEAACDSWAPAVPDPDDVAFCAGVAPVLCRCGIWLDPEDCVGLAAERCLYSLGAGGSCRNAEAIFVACLEGLEVCDRDTAREMCLDVWNAWSGACRL